MTSAEIRQSFLDFFRSKQHTIVPSSSLLPDAPNLLFTNAGMNQFVPIFLGQKAPDVSKWAGASPALDTRAADTQKCIRAGGKHNDLEDVGFDTYHHTFFEMLGNWSFGDYFKQEAIAWAWELVTEVWRFPKHRLYATVYQPGPGEPAEFDQEAFAHWARLFTAAGLDPKVHICTGAKKDNFWMMGETGPCGPCSELHIDLTPAANTGGRLVNAGSAQCIEIWNLVFIQFNAGPDGTFSPLPARHVDTGMGFERVTGIIQNTRGLTDFSRPISNYETDIFRPLFDELERLSGKEYCSTLPAKQNLAAASPTPGTADAAPNTPSACVSTNMGSADNSTGMGSAYNSTGTGSADNSTGMGSADNSTGMGSADNSTGMGSAGVPPAAVGVSPTAAAGDTPGCLPHPAARDAQQSDRDGRAPQACAPQACPPQACPQTETQVQLDVAFRVIADHLRTLSFAIADGIQPSNDGRGYVLRRILRRAVRYGRSLGLHEPFFFKLVDVLAETMGGVFPEIRAKQKHVQEVIRVEEEAFNRTLDRGIALFNQEVAGLADGCSRMRGEFAFKLYDTYGFPLDLTELMARERGLTVDVAGFDTLMAEQRDRARKAQKKQVVALSQIETQAPTVFVGYDKLETTAKVLELVGLKDKTAVVLDTSACYAEMGGQLGDTGELSQGNRSWRIVGTLKNGDTWLHFIEEDGARGSGPRAAVGGEASERGAVGETPTAAGETPALPALPALPMLGTEIMVTVDAARRAAIQRHHTVTHLLHWALHQVVSPDVAQKGSFVGPDKLTFDFNSAPLAPAQVAAVERLVNERILENAPVTWLEAKYDHIKNRPDIMQFFGEKYSEWVRVVQIGGTPTALDGYAMELCGGTHCRAVGEIGLFRILAENAIAAGVRRIEAVAGLEAYRQASDELALLKSIAGKVNAPVGELERRIESMLEQQRALDKRLRALAQQQAAQAARDLVARAQTVNGMPVIVARVDGDGDALQGLVNELKGQFKGVILLGGVAQGAVAFVASVSPEFTARVQAGKLIQQIAPVVGGKGGGKPDNARGGGKETARIDEALAKGRSLVG
jgi:alanyl-tRNA synthetase